MSQSWINIEGELVSLEETPLLLNELNIIPIFLRRFLEKKFTKEIVPTREEQTNYYQKFLKRENISDKTSLINWLNHYGVSESDMELNLYKSLKIEKFKNEKFSDKVEDLFLKRKSDLDRVTYSLIRSKSRDKISELNIRLKEEEDTFSQLSSEFSEGVENVLHGLIGPIEISKVNPVIAERLKASKSGQLWPPFECEGWWVLLKHERFIPATLNLEMRNRLINELYEVWIASKIKIALSSLKESVKE